MAPEHKFKKAPERALLDMRAQQLAPKKEIPPERALLDMQAQQLDPKKATKDLDPVLAPYMHPLKPPIEPSAPFDLGRVPHGALRDAAFANVVEVENGFIVSLLKYRYKKWPAIQGMQLTDTLRLIWFSQITREWEAVAPWPRTISEHIELIDRIIEDLREAVARGY